MNGMDAKMYKIESASFRLELTPAVAQDEHPFPQSHSLRVRVSSYGFSAETFMDVDEPNLASFAVRLNGLYDSLAGEAYLEDPYGAWNCIEFHAKTNGHIRITGRLNNREAHGFEQELKFDNEIDQTYLRDFAKALFRDYGKYAD